MKYHELLSSYISRSGLSLTQITNALNEKGFSSHKGYISKLQNGKVAPAGDELNKALAEVLEGDPDKLIWYAYVEKAPDVTREVLSSFGDEMVGAAKKLISKFPGFFEGKYKKEDYIMSEEFRDYSIALWELTQKHFPEPTFELNENSEYSSIINFNNYRGDTIKENHLDGFEKVNSVIKVPVLGYIAAGSPILAEEHIIDYMEIPNPDKYSQDELFSLVVKGDSMTGSRIYEGDRVVVRIQNEVENGQIAVVNVDGENATLKKVKKYEDGAIWLISTNEKYAPIPLTNERARIIGKVIQVIFEP
jgi:SOS regulatory protein LexA